MNKIHGVIHGVYTYHNKRVYKVICDNGKKVFVDDGMIPIKVDENLLQTIEVMIDGKLKSPWIGS